MEISLMDAVSFSTGVKFCVSFFVSFIIYGIIYVFSMSAEKEKDKNGDRIYKNGRYVSNKLAFITYFSMVLATSSVFMLSDIQKNVDAIQSNHPKTLFHNDFSKITSGIDEQRIIDVNKVIGHDDILDVSVIDRDGEKTYQFRVYNDNGEIRDVTVK